MSFWNALNLAYFFPPKPVPIRITVHFCWQLRFTLASFKHSNGQIILHLISRSKILLKFIFSSIEALLWFVPVDNPSHILPVTNRWLSFHSANCINNYNLVIIGPIQKMFCLYCIIEQLMLRHMKSNNIMHKKLKNLIIWHLWYGYLIFYFGFSRQGFSVLF